MLTEQQQIAVDALMERFTSRKKEEAFSGFIYKDKTKIPRLAQPKTMTVKARQVWKPKFIAGYKSDQFRYVLEIWYYPWKGEYRLYDKFGKIVQGRKQSEDGGYGNLNEAVDDFMYIIGTKEPRDDADLFGNSKKDQEDFVDEFIMDSVIMTDEGMDELLKENTVSREFVRDMISEDVTEYQTSRMNKHRIRKFWKIFGKDVRMPTDYIPSKMNIRQQYLRIVNQNKEASFVIGYTMKGKIDVEIWYVKDTIEVDGGFAVFDLTSGQILAENLSTLRWAMFEVAKKLGVSGDRITDVTGKNVAKDAAAMTRRFKQQREQDKRDREAERQRRKDSREQARANR